MNAETLTKAESLVRELAAKLGEPAIDLALLAARIDAAEHIIGGMFAALLAVAAYKAGRWCHTKMRPELEKDFIKQNDSITIGGFAGIAASAVVGFISFLFAFNALSIKAWVSLWHPELWLASKVLAL